MRLLPVLVLIVLLTACSAPTPPPVDLNARANITGNIVTITNDDAYDWQNVQVELRPSTRAFSGGYTVQVSLLRSGDMTQHMLPEFANGDGTRFNALTTQIAELWVSADTPRGHGYAFFTPR